MRLGGKCPVLFLYVPVDDLKYIYNDYTSYKW